MHTLSKEQLEIQKAARAFAKGEFRPIARELDAASRFDERICEKAAELGFLAVFLLKVPWMDIRVSWNA